MSEEAKVEEGAEAQVEAADNDEFSAAFTELVKEEGQGAATPSDDEPEKVEEGQVAEATPEGQGKDDTPGEDAQKAPASETPDDLWKDADPRLRAAFEAEQARAAKAESVVKVHSGRLSQAYRERDALVAKVADFEKAAGAPEGDGKSSEDRLKALREEYPDFAPILDKLDAAEAKVTRLEGERQTEVQAQTEEQLHEQRTILEQAHPDWGKVVLDPKFEEWALGQPTYIQDGIRANNKFIVDGSSAADIIDRFKRDTAPKEDPAKAALEAKRREQMEGLSDPSLRAPAAKAADGGDFDAEFKRFVAEDRRQAQRGR